MDRDWLKVKVYRQALVLLLLERGHGGEMVCW